MKKSFFALLVVCVSLTPIFATQAKADSFWKNILNLFHKSTPVLERAPSPAPTPIYVPDSTTIPAKAPIKVPTNISVPAPVKTYSEVGTTTATTTEFAATSTAPFSPESTSEPVFLSPGSILFTVSSPASSAKSGTLTVYAGTRITIWWEVPNYAYKCANSWGYPFINSNNNQKTGTEVFPDTTTVYSISCTNENNEIIDAKSVRVEVVPLTSASIGIIPILNMWGLFKSLFVGM